MSSISSNNKTGRTSGNSGTQDWLEQYITSPTDQQQSRLVLLWHCDKVFNTSEVLADICRLTNAPSHSYHPTPLCELIFWNSVVQHNRYLAEKQKK